MEYVMVKLNPKRISRRGLELIKSFEDLELEAYLCEAGVWTIGWGHTKGVKKGKKIKKAKAEKLLLKDISWAVKTVLRMVTTELLQYQFDALVSLVFNIGCGAFQKSTLLKRLNANNYAAAADQFAVWRIADGEVSSGLVRRRKEEKSLFLGEIFDEPGEGDRTAV